MVLPSFCNRGILPIAMPASSSSYRYNRPPRQKKPSKPLQIPVIVADAKPKRMKAAPAVEEHREVEPERSASVTARSKPRASIFGAVS